MFAHPLYDTSVDGAKQEKDRSIASYSGRAEWELGAPQSASAGRKPLLWPHPLLGELFSVGRRKRPSGPTDVQAGHVSRHSRAEIPRWIYALHPGGTVAAWVVREERRSWRRMSPPHIRRLAPPDVLVWRRERERSIKLN